MVCDRDTLLRTHETRDYVFHSVRVKNVNEQKHLGFASQTQTSCNIVFLLLLLTVNLKCINPAKNE